MASLTGNLIKDTYQSLLKIIDNGNATSTAKEITDGEGNSIGVSVDTSGNVTVNGTLQGSTVTDGTTSISDLQANKQETSEKGAASGYAPLDSNSKVPIANIPDSVLGQLEYKGTWDANNDSPALPSASGVKGNYYVVSIAGVYETVDYEVGDWIVSNGTIWEKVDNSDKVSSVNGATGAVVLDTDNISEGSTNQYYTSDRANSDFDTRLATKNTGDLTEGSNLYYTEDRVSANTDVAANTAKTGISTEQSDAIIANTAKNTYPPEDATKLLGIEAGANVTDVANVTTALNSISIKELDDVSSTSPSNNQVLQFNSTSGEYEPSTIDTGGSVDSVNGQTGVVSLGLLELDDVGADGTSGQVLTTDGLGSFTFTTVSGGGGAVDSVNGQTGTVVLDTDDISEGTNKYTTAANLTKLGNISVTQAVNLDTMESDIATNNSKVGISAQQAADIVTNNAKVSYPSTDSTKVGFISVTQAVNLDTIEIDVATNNAKVGITTQQANDITANNAKVSMVLGTTAGTALEGDTELLQLGTTSTTALAGDTTTISAQQASDISQNTTDISTNSSDIATNTSSISTNTSNISTNATNIASNDTDISALQSDVSTNTSNISTNTSDISTNTSAIATNTGNISTNATNISSNDTDIATNASNISSNTSSISTNATNIATNVTNIASNTSDISTNTSSIATNVTDIATNTGNISTNATNISSNTTDIATNVTGISTNASAISTNTGNISTNTTNIATNASDISTNVTNIATNAANIPTNNNQLTNGAGYTTNVGTVTNVTVGTGLDVINGTTTPSLSLDLSEFADMTADMVGTDEFIVLDSSSERRKAANEIESTILNLEKQSNAIGNAIDFSARVTLDGGVAEGTSTIIKNLQNIL